MNEPSQLATEILGLINGKPRSPTAGEIDALIAQHRALAPGSKEIDMKRWVFAIEDIARDTIFLIDGNDTIEKAVGGQIDTNWKPSNKVLLAWADLVGKLMEIRTL